MRRVHEIDGGVAALESLKEAILLKSSPQEMRDECDRQIDILGRRKCVYLRPRHARRSGRTGLRRKGEAEASPFGKRSLGSFFLFALRLDPVRQQGLQNRLEDDAGALRRHRHSDLASEPTPLSPRTRKLSGNVCRRARSRLVSARGSLQW